jgi:hypothetical protein
MKKLLLIAVLMLAAFNFSGCATIAGSIIGYQSGELAAGAAIGAAIDITGAVLAGMHQKEAEKKQEEKNKEREKKINESINIYTEEGYIRVGKISAEGRNFGEEFRKKFDNIGWRYSETTERPSLTEKIVKRVFICKTTDDKEFTLELLRETNQDLLVFIKPTDANKELQSMVTSQVGIWIREIAGQ